MTFSSSTFALALFAVMTGVGAEEENGATASLVPVGANSDAYWSGDGPGLRAVALDPGAAPPATLTVRDREGFKTVPTILNRPSPALPVRAGRLRIFSGPPSTVNGEPPVFADFKLPRDATDHYDIFLTRAGGRPDWTDAESLILASSEMSFPQGAFRLVNLTAMPVKWKVGAELINLDPRRARVVPRATDPFNSPVPVQAGHGGGDGFRVILRTGIHLAEGQRVNLIVYPGRDPRKPCEVIWYFQFPPTLPHREKG